MHWKHPNVKPYLDRVILTFNFLYKPEAIRIIFVPFNAWIFGLAFWVSRILAIVLSKVVIVVLLAQVLQPLCDSAIIHHQAEVKLILANEIVSTQDVTVIDLDGEVVGARGINGFGRLDVEKHTPVERGHTGAAAPMSVCFLFFSASYPAPDKNITDTLIIDAWDIFSVQNCQSNFIFLNRFPWYIPNFILRISLSRLIKDINPTSNSALRKACAWMVYLSFFNRLVHKRLPFWTKLSIIQVNWSFSNEVISKQVIIIICIYFDGVRSREVAAKLIALVK